MASGGAAGSLENLSSAGKSVSTTPGRTRASLQELRQAMIALGPDDDIDRRLAAQDLRPLRLGDAAGDDQHRPAARPAAFLLELTQLAEFGKDLFRRAFADMAGVENDELGVLDEGRLPVSRLGGEIAHALGVVDVHLASE